MTLNGPTQGADFARCSCMKACAAAASILLVSALATSHAQPLRSDDAAEYERVQAAAMRRAQVWLDPVTPIEEAALGTNPPDAKALGLSDVVRCQFKPGGVSGSTPKFDCTLHGGETVKVKYGRDNPEVYSEIISSRLLAAVGFPADRMYVVDRVRCFGCPPDPFAGLQCVNEGVGLDVCFPNLDFDHYEDFEAAVIERPVEGRRIETAKERGWTWEQLASIDPAAGGSPRAHVDALRLLAVFLNHWDNKAKNQRLLCLGETDPPGRLLDPRPCSRPVAMVQDLGGTFGPPKLDLANWARTPIWIDTDRCAVSMKALPYEGSTFPDTEISEEGRRFLGERLSRFSAQQIRELFDGARLSRYPHKDALAADVLNWVRAFQHKVSAIVDRAPCPM